MPDFDVAAVGLSSPPAAAYKTTYRPAITVKNNGVHDADVVGYIAIIERATGLQVFYSPVYLAELGPGGTGAALATATHDFQTEGDYLAYGYVTTDHDSVPQNNNLAPTSFHVGPGEPPTPVIVPAHAPQHENGGSDEIEIDGLAGKLADPQEPEDHAATHQLGGPDQLSIGGLSGKAAEPQTPITHSNAYHNPTLATSSELTAHQNATAVHSAALNLANRETTGPNTGLVPFTQLATGSKVTPVGDRYLREDRFFHAPMPDGAIITWLAADPIPEGWQLYSELPTPTPMTIRIRKLPTPP
jgi:hypothetical protein